MWPADGEQQGIDFRGLNQSFQRQKAVSVSKVLIGIVTHNRAELLVRAIESALAQDYSNKEIAVLDDGSSDDTPLLRAQFPQVRWYTTATSIGCIQARNRLMRETDAEFFFSLDDDAWLIRGDEISLGVAFMKPRSWVGALAYDILSRARPTTRARMAPRPSHLFWGCGHMLRLSAVQAVGDYPPSPGRYGSEESDLCIRLLDQAYEIFSLPGVHVWHEETETSRHYDSQYISQVCNDLAFAYRRCPHPTILWLLPGKIFRHLIFAVKHRRVMSFWRGTIAFVKALPSIKSGRRPVTRATFGEFRRRARNATQVA
jgi:GT2 family glycosyltransferase